MAKSLRSKRQRKMRAIKRIRYGAKELTRLKDMLAKAKENQKNAEEIITMIDLSRKQKRTSNDESTKTADEKNTEIGVSDSTMDVDTVVRKYNKKTFKDQFGNYPIWVSQKQAKRKRKMQKKGKISKNF